jgi:DNA-binding NarL/FixJ family response regulator
VSFASLSGNPPPLVGRERELAVLHQNFDAAINGHGSLVLIGGEAGVGKTALANALCREATERGARVLVGRCYDLTDTPPYGPWLEVFEHYSASDGLPPLPPAFAEPGTIGDVPNQFALFRQVFAFLSSLARQQPVLLLLEDLHWADVASLDLTRFLARQLDSLPLLLIATYRADALTRHHPLFPLLPILEREATARRLNLRRLAPIAVRALLTPRYRLPAEDEDRLAVYLVERAEGNAFFTVQLLRALEDDGVLRPDGVGWMLGDLNRSNVPVSVTQVLQGRVARLGEEAERMLRIGAVISQEVPLELWAVVAEVDEEALLDLVERAVEASLLEVTDTGVRFVHALLREMLYDAILPPRRRRIHRAVAEALVAAGDPDPAATANQFARAGDARAVEWLIRAGDRAIQAYAWHSALADYEAAHALADALGLAFGDSPALHLRIARARRAIDPTRAIASLADAERWLTGEQRAVASYALFYRGVVRWFAGELAGGIPDMEAGLAALDALTLPERRELRPLLDTLLLSQEIHPAGYLSSYLLAVGRYADAVVLAERIIAVEEQGGEAVSLGGDPHGEAYDTLCFVHAMRGQPEQALDTSARSRTLHRTMGAYLDEGLEALITVRWVLIPYFTERVEERHRVAREAESAWQRIGDYTDVPPRFAHLPCLELEGEWEEAWALCLAGRQMVHPGGFLRSVASAILGDLALRRGEADLAWSLVHEALPGGTGTEPGEAPVSTALVSQKVAATLALEAGDLAAAHDWLVAHARWLDRLGAVLGQAELACLWGQYYRAARDDAQAEHHARRALAHASQPHQPLALLTAHRLLGELETDVGHVDQAQTHLSEALVLAESSRAVYERALTLLAMAALEIAVASGEAAMRQIEAARAILGPLRALPALARADRLADRARPMRAVPPAFPAGLSVREVEVLRLLAAGKSNREIADALFLSPGTINVHVTHILTKTNTTNRTEAALFARDHGLA